MKKFERLSQNERKQEIKNAAVKLFNEKGFGSTTMENIVSEVTLSKGGVYRIYPSLTDILSEIIIDGMHLRNAFYEDRVKEAFKEGKEINKAFITEMILDSLFIYPEVSRIYVEFLIEKRRNPKLQELYKKIEKETVADTLALIDRYSIEALDDLNEETLKKTADIMNSLILSISVLDLQDVFFKDREKITTALQMALNL